MSRKLEITKKLVALTNVEADESYIRRLIPLWWMSSRHKGSGGLRLTERGFAAFQKADIQSHKITLDTEIFYNNQLIIGLDQYIDCPWFITRDSIYVFDDKMAVQLILFSGNIQKFVLAKSQRKLVDS